VQLAVANPPDTNRFYFTITGENGRKYRILATTNFINWAGEESFPGYANADGVVQNTNETSLFSIPRVPNQKFLRATPYLDTEICIAQLEAIYFAMKLWAIETKRSSYAPVTASDILPYLKDMVCPSGGTSFADSYAMYNPNDAPICLQVGAFHIVPYQGH
jgi:hypothetical protein